MAFEFRLPDIGEGVVEGEVVRWLVKAGELVREDQPMVEVMTDKATVEIPSPKAGRITQILAPEGKLCAVGAVMVVIDLGGNGAAKPAPAATATATAASPIEVVHAAANVTRAAGGKVLATPATRKLARELNVDLSGLAGSGPHGRVTQEDVRGNANGDGPLPTAARQPAPTAARTPAPSAPPTPNTVAKREGDERLPFRGVRKKIAENMHRSKSTAAHFTYVEECDATELSAVRTRAKKRAEERGVKLSFLPFIIKAVVAGLKKFPIVNSTLDETAQEIVLRKQYHIGVAAATADGLAVPVVKDADRKSIFEIARELETLSEKTRTGKATRDDLTGSTFTISSLGALGGVLATPIINFPEVAVLGVHKLKPTPVVRDGQIVIRDIMNLSISLDHRIVDGYEGALFLQHVIELLQDPTTMFMEMI
jgi:pyruvate dehydrogenase E2 component (dihydrolipoamide acetyltransferase)